MTLPLHACPHGPRPSPLRRRAAACALAALALLVAALGPARAADQVSPEEVKAAFCFNLARFVQWPAAAFEKPDAPFVIGVLADDAFSEALERTIAGRSVGGHALQVKRLKHAAEGAKAQILFLGGGVDEAEANAALPALRPRPVLTVADADAGVRATTMVTFFRSQNRIRLALTLAPIREAGLSVSSKLLQVAVVSDADH